MSMAETPRLVFHDRVGWSNYPELEDFSIDILRNLVARAWQFQNGPSAVTVDVVWLCGVEHDRLHERFLDDPTPTDVITFPYGDEDLFGEIVVNLDMAREQASLRNIDMCEEVSLYVVHGALHLLGLEDVTVAQQKEMRAAEAEVLSTE